MPRKASTRKTTKRSASKKETPSYEYEHESMPVPEQRTVWTQRKYLAVAALALIVLGFIVYKNKSWFVVATVNGQPIARSTFNDKLVQRYGANTLDGMVGETLIMQEAQKKGITVSDAEINQRLDKMKASLPAGMSFGDALKMQGMNEEDFRHQLMTSILVDKLLADKATFSAQEVDAYINENKTTMTATDEAGMKQEAAQRVKEQKIQTLFQSWYQNLQKTADIRKFL